MAAYSVSGKSRNKKLYRHIFVAQPGSDHHLCSLDKNQIGFFHWLLDCGRKSPLSDQDYLHLHEGLIL